MADGNQLLRSELSVALELPNLPSMKVVEAIVDEGLSRRTIASVVVTTMEDLDFREAFDGPSLLRIEGGGYRLWTLRLGDASFLNILDSSFHYRLRLYDPLHFLGLSRNTRKFRNMSAQEIVSQVLTEGQVKFEFRITRETPQRKYCAQYRETNLAFVERLLEFEGIYYQLAEDGTVVFMDKSPSAEMLREGMIYNMIEASGAMTRGDLGVHELRRGSRMTTGRVTLADYNWKKTEPLRESGWGEADTQLEQYAYPGGYRKSEQGVALARMRAEAHRVGAQYLEGKGNDVAMSPGFGFEVGGLAAQAFAGKYLVTHIVHNARPGKFRTSADESGDKAGFENVFTSIPLDRPFRPMLTTPRPTIHGTHTAMVRGPGGEEIHTDQYGRFRAQLHWDREAQGTDEDSRWLRLVQETASSMVLARTGWEVIVGYIDGDPDRPIGLGRAINGQMTPTYGLPSNKNMMSIKTPSYPSASGGFNELKMDDSAASQHISLRAEKDLDALVKNDKTETIGENETHTVGTDLKREVFGNQSLTVGGNDTSTFNATAELKAASDRDVTVSGSETVNIGAGQKNTITEGETEKVGSVRLSVIGSIKIPDFKAMAKAALEGVIPPVLKPFVLAKNSDDLKKAFLGAVLPPQLQGLANAKNGGDAARTLLGAVLPENLKGLANAKNGDEAIRGLLGGVLPEEFKALALAKNGEEAGRALIGGLLPPQLQGLAAAQTGKEARQALFGAVFPKEINALFNATNAAERRTAALNVFFPEDAFKGVTELATKLKAGENPLKGLVAEMKEKATETIKTGGKEILDAAKDAAQEKLKAVGDQMLDAAKASWGQDKDVGKALTAAFKDVDLGKTFNETFDAAVTAGQEKLGTTIESLKNIPQESIGGYVKGVLPKIGGFTGDEKLEGLGGFLPSVDQLKQWYSMEAIKQGIDTRLQGFKETFQTNVKGIEEAVGKNFDTLKALPETVRANLEKIPEQLQTNITKLGDDWKKQLEGFGDQIKAVPDQVKAIFTPEKLKEVFSQATGGLSDIALKLTKGQNGKLFGEMGWDDVDKIVSMFTTGGLSKTATKSIKQLVGGAKVEAAIGPISWGSKIAWAETIGGVKLTKTPKDIVQGVEGKMMVTVLGKVIRDATNSIEIKAKESDIKVTNKASYAADDTMQLRGTESATFESSDTILIEGGGSSMKMTAGSIVLSGQRIGITTSAKLVISGKKLKVGT